MAVDPRQQILASFNFADNAKPESWTMDKPIKEWNGVGNAQGEVMAINLYGQRLKGTVNWAQLPRSLTQLVLGNNQFTGTVDWAQLPRSLIVLHLGNNQLTGAINLQAAPPNLAQLHVYDNKFSGVVDLRHLPSTLQYFQIRGNSQLRLDYDINNDGSIRLPQKKLCAMHRQQLLDFIKKQPLSDNQVIRQLSNTVQFLFLQQHNPCAADITTQHDQWMTQIAVEFRSECEIAINKTKQRFLREQQALIELEAAQRYDIACEQRTSFVQIVQEAHISERTVLLMREHFLSLPRLRINMEESLSRTVISSKNNDFFAGVAGAGAAANINLQRENEQLKAQLALLQQQLLQQQQQLQPQPRRNTNNNNDDSDSTEYDPCDDDQEQMPDDGLSGSEVTTAVKRIAIPQLTGVALAAAASANKKDDKPETGSSGQVASLGDRSDTSTVNTQSPPFSARSGNEDGDPEQPLN